MWATRRSSSPRRPGAEALAEVGVEVHRAHPTAGRLARRRSIERMTEPTPTEPAAPEAPSRPSRADRGPPHRRWRLGAALVIGGLLLFAGQFATSASTTSAGRVDRRRRRRGDPRSWACSSDREQGMVIGGTIATTVGLVLSTRTRPGAGRAGPTPGRWSARRPAGSASRCGACAAGNALDVRNGHVGPARRPRHVRRRLPVLRGRHRHQRRAPPAAGVGAAGGR